jgi:hypothetical protein
MAMFKEYNRTIRRELPSTEQGKALHNADASPLKQSCFPQSLQPSASRCLSDLSIEAYAADAFIQRDNLYPPLWQRSYASRRP